MKKSVGTSLLRVEGHKKLTGQTKYIDDIQFPDMLHVVTVRSTVSRGKIKTITFESDIPWDEIHVISASDIPGKNEIACILDDQPMLADGVVNHVGEAILLLAHRNKYLVEKALNNITIEYEELPSVLNLDDSFDKKAIVWGKDNIQKYITIEKGDLDKGFAEADFIIEGEYRTGAQEQMYIETNGMIASYSKEGGVTVWGSMQCPYYVQKALKTLFNFEDDKIRVIQAETGGGFGGKEEFPSVLAGHAALVAYKTGRPAKLIYDRAEDLLVSTKRHPSRTRHKTGVKKDGTLVAMELEFVLDGGAYATLSSVVLSRGAVHACGPYKCDNLAVRSTAVATNSPPYGAYRGFGAPQSIFSTEVHFDKVAKKLGMTPEAFRRKNLVKKGDHLSTGQEVKEIVDWDNILGVALKDTDYQNKYDGFAEENKNSKYKRGIGFATFMHGAGFTGSGESYLASVASVEITPKGVRVLAANTEIGQGKNTVFTQIVADALGVSPAVVEIAQPDTHVVPDSGPTVASRTTMVVGKLIEEAALKVQAGLKESGRVYKEGDDDGFILACQQYLERIGPLCESAQYIKSKNIEWDDETYKGDAYATYAWAAYVAEITIDTTTDQIWVDNLYTNQEVGKVVNPVLATGQIEGGITQAIGWATTEEMVYEKGAMANNRMTNYIIPTSADMGNLEVKFIEIPTEYGPQGAKGIGELPMDGPAPAIINAVNHALGLDACEIPMTPEKLSNLRHGESL